MTPSDVIDHEENCAACGVNDRAEDSRLCASCRDALVRTDGGTVEDGTEQSDCPLCDGSGFVTSRTKPDIEAECLTDDCPVEIFEVCST